MKSKLDKDELEILDSLENGEWKPIKNMNSVIAQHKEYTKEAMKKDRRINIRISSRDLDLLQVKAIEEGLPYQTLISSILHKYVNS